MKRTLILLAVTAAGAGLFVWAQFRTAAEPVAASAGDGDLVRAKRPQPPASPPVSGPGVLDAPARPARSAEAGGGLQDTITRAMHARDLYAAISSLHTKRSPGSFVAARMLDFYCDQLLAAASQAKSAGLLSGHPDLGKLKGKTGELAQRIQAVQEGEARCRPVLQGDGFLKPLANDSWGTDYAKLLAHGVSPEDGEKLFKEIARQDALLAEHPLGRAWTLIHEPYFNGQRWGGLKDRETFYAALGLAHTQLSVDQAGGAPHLALLMACINVGACTGRPEDILAEYGDFDEREREAIRRVAAEMGPALLSNNAAAFAASPAKAK